MSPEDLKALKLALDKRHELESFHRFKRRLSEKEKVLLLKGAALGKRRHKRPRYSRLPAVW